MHMPQGIGSSASDMDIMPFAPLLAQTSLNALFRQVVEKPLRLDRQCRCSRLGHMFDDFGQKRRIVTDGVSRAVFPSALPHVGHHPCRHGAGAGSPGGSAAPLRGGIPDADDDGFGKQRASVSVPFLAFPGCSWPAGLLESRSSSELCLTSTCAWKPLC